MAHGFASPLNTIAYATDIDIVDTRERLFADRAFRVCDGSRLLEGYGGLLSGGKFRALRETY